VTGSCPSCDGPVHFAGSAWARCDACRTMVFPASGGPRVVVAHESERLAVHIGVVLMDAGMQPLHAPHGAAALRLIEAKRPPAAVLDVALPEVLSFQIIDRLRSRPELANIKVVLVAAVFNRMAYKRRPTTLYGADDYVEQHHVRDLLPGKLCELMGLAGGKVDGGRERLEGQDTRTDLVGAERVSALARSIAADIMLYHPEEVLHTVREGRSSALERATEEGRRLLEDLIAPARLGAGDPVGEALQKLIVELGRGRS
jgi:CheY-like chemotaxis protein